MKAVEFSRHARRRMQLHDIAADHVVGVLRNPSRVAPSVKGRYNGFGKIGDRFLRVTWKEEETRLLVVTVTPRKRDFEVENENRIR